MAEILNFREFYQKAPIQINQRDWSAIQKEERFIEMFKSCTHWLIALEGSEMNQRMVHWRVLIFPAEASGSFNYTCPFFKSDFLRLFNDALELSKKIEQLAKEDQLFSIYAN